MIHLTDSQQAVIDHFPLFLMSEDKEMTISGPAGTGKTFLIKHLANIQSRMQKFIHALDQKTPKRRIVYTATTNKAANVLEKMTGEPCSTIHSLLGLRVRSNYKTGKQELVSSGRSKLYSGSVVFVDEASMINRELLKTIRQAIAEIEDVKVVFIGDEYQLPPVKEDVCAVFQAGPNTVLLKDIKRQAAYNPIIELASEYRNCLDDHELPWPEPQDHHNHIHTYEDRDDFLSQINKRFIEDHSPDDLKILAWSNQRVREYNRYVRSLEGRQMPFEAGEHMVSNKPIVEGNRVIVPSDGMITIGDICEATQNGIDGYEILIRSENGDILVFQPSDWKEANELAKIYAKDAKKTRNWQPYFYIKNNWVDLRPIHASTVHKSQGSTYRDVFIDVGNIGKNNHWREVARLMYVAITRASNSVHLFGKLDERYKKQALIDLMEPFKNVDLLRQSN